MIIKFHNKSVEKFPEWKVIEHERSKSLTLINSPLLESYKNALDKDETIFSIEDAVNLEDKYFVKQDYIPKEVLKYIKKIGGKF